MCLILSSCTFDLPIFDITSFLACLFQGEANCTSSVNLTDMALTAGVNFINILCANFLYESALRSFSLVTFWLCIFLALKYCRKRREYNVDEIDHRFGLLHVLQFIIKKLKVDFYVRFFAKTIVQLYLIFWNFSQVRFSLSNSMTKQMKNSFVIVILHLIRNWILSDLITRSNLVQEFAYMWIKYANLPINHT